GEAVTKEIFIQKCPLIYRKRAVRRGPYEVPLVSIYVPLYNREKYIAECVQSALEQTVDDLEVVICNDGSTDASVKIVNRYFADDPRVKLITQKNGGIGAASNTAVRAARGCFVGQLDADDVLKRDAVEICVKELEANPKLSLVYGTTEYIDEKSTPFSDGWNWSRFSREYLLTRMICHHFRLFRRRDWARTDGFDENIKNAVDYDMMLKLAEKGDVLHLNRILYEYRKHEEATTVTANDLQTTNHFVVLNEALRRLNIKDFKIVQQAGVNGRVVEFQPANV
ncbi:MAG TPA: glycosyltransferase, partial [Ramlibacter sp.]|nr:glycosyltransferase [Ramlibacter sp.]